MRTTSKRQRSEETVSNSVETPVAYTHRQILAVLSGLMLGMFLAALDQTIVATAIRTIADDLDGYSLQAWATTAYLVTATLATPLYGKLSDIYGRKPFFMFAITVFVIGSVMCTFSTSMYMLAAFRAVQGLGAGGLFSLALTIIGDIVSPRERAKYQGYFLALFGTSSVLGPVLGGVFAGQDVILGIDGWRWVFLVNVPVGLVALTVVSRVLHLPRRPSGSRRIDWWGAIALAVGVVPLLVVAEQGHSWGWGSSKSLACYVIGVIGVLAFVSVELAMKDDALIPMRFFRNSTFALGVVISLVVGAVMFGGITLLPQYLQVVKGSSPTLAGFQILPMVLGLMAGSVVSGQMISRTGRYRYFPILGTALIGIGAFLLHTLAADTPMPVVMVFMLILGLGLGNLMQPLTLAIQNALPPQDMGVSTGAATFFRQIGGTAGVAIFLSILFSRLTPAIGERVTAAAGTADFRRAVAAAAQSNDPAEAAMGQGMLSPDHTGVSGVLTDSSVIGKLDDVLALPFREGFADAIGSVFLSVSMLAVVAFVLTLLWKEVPLRSESGLQAAARGDAQE
ncbi:MULTISPECIES: DHA2 family efflux MFS transporter permease subunit [unclassified Rhodococcus (in: high G+C Gram-positive bacteria)]|uniref:DHA2 family efflux MFS transporter permease subunit n=1 Tax=unclassified Rhodococcus (in: high G+C Gram-positive bacteria) TaxID=192944 RepID=UPI0012F63BFB